MIYVQFQPKTSNDGAETAVPDAQLGTNVIANPEDASENPAVEEADGAVEVGRLII